MANIEKRISDLEAATGGTGRDGCARCGGTLITRVNGKIHSVSKHGHRFPHAAAVAFAAEEEPEKRCPLCGTVRRALSRIGGLPHES
jgi:hypothetical protein